MKKNDRAVAFLDLKATAFDYREKGKTLTAPENS